MKYIPLLVFPLFLLACATNAAPSKQVSSSSGEIEYPRDEHGEVMPFYTDKAAQIAVDNAIVKANQTNKDALIVMGANWCHDSRALATHFEKPRFKAMLNSHYVLEYIDVAKKNKNQDIARSFGIDGTKGTPTVFIVDGEGKVRNLETAPTWRNAASRNEDDIYNYFRDYAHDKSKP